MQKNRSPLFILAVFLTSISTCLATEGNNILFVERGNSYNLTHNFEVTFTEYSITSDTGIVILTQNRNLSDLYVSFAIHIDANYKVSHQINITTKDATGVVIDYFEYYLYIINLTNAESANIVNSLRDAINDKEDLENENIILEQNLTNLTGWAVPKTGWAQYGSESTLAIIISCFTLASMSLFAIPFIVRFRQQRNNERKEKIFQVEQRKKSENIKTSSDLNMNPYVKMYDGKRKYYEPLLSPQEQLAVKGISKSCDAGVFLTPFREFITDGSATRKRTSVDQIRKKFNDYVAYTNSYLLQKHVVVAILKFLNHKGWKNGIGELS